MVKIQNVVLIDQQEVVDLVRTFREGSEFVNARQKLILKICALIIFAMMLYPPYQLLGRGMGYHFIFIGPDYRQTTIDGGLLLVQWVGVCLIGGIGYLLARGDAGGSDPNVMNVPIVKLGVRLLILAMRAIRALASIYVVVGGLGLIFDLVNLMVNYETVAVDPGNVAALLLMKFVGLSAVVGVAWGLRLLINKLNKGQTGTAVPLLANWRSL